MKGNAIDNMVRQVLIDAISLDLQQMAPAPDLPFEPSEQHKKEMAEMLRDPNAWAQKKQGNATE